MRFHFRAYEKNGKISTGIIEAGNKESALGTLLGAGKTVVEIRESRPSLTFLKTGGISGKTRILAFSKKFDPAQLFTDLSTLTTAGLTLQQSLRIIYQTANSQEQISKARLLHEDLLSGESFSNALARIKSVPEDVLGLVKAGENSGELISVFEALTQRYNEQAKIRADLFEAISYPAFLIVLMLAAIWVLTFVLVPSIAPLFENSGHPAPIIVLVLSDLKSFLESNSVLLLLMPLAVAALLATRTSVRNMFSRAVWKAFSQIPLLGQAIVKMELARYQC